MKLHYCATGSGNFGDDMNLWFWDELMPGWRDLDPGLTLFGIGTILTGHDLRQHERVLVCGSGTGYGGLRPDDLAHAEIGWVRGPRTAAHIGIDPAQAISDPACVAPRLPSFAGLARGTGGTLFIPHRLTALLDLNWDRIAAATGMRVVLPLEEARAVISAIGEAELVVTESMHGAILADAFRVPWVPVAISHHFNTFKWNDWADSVEVELQLEQALGQLRAAWFFLRNLKRRVKSRGRGRKARPGSRSGPGAATAEAFSNPNYLGEDERARVKALIRTLAPVVERVMIRDLKRVARARPHLSREAVLADRMQRIEDRAGTLLRRIEAGEVLPPR